MVITPEEIMERVSANNAVNPSLSPADRNGDGVVDTADLTAMLELIR